MTEFRYNRGQSGDGYGRAPQDGYPQRQARTQADSGYSAASRDQRRQAQRDYSASRARSDSSQREARSTRAFSDDSYGRQVDQRQRVSTDRSSRAEASQRSAQSYRGREQQSSLRQQNAQRGGASPRPSSSDDRGRSAVRDRQAAQRHSAGRSVPDGARRTSVQNRPQVRGQRPNSRIAPDAQKKSSVAKVSNQPKPNVFGASKAMQRFALGGFTVILALGMVIGFAFFARPTTSELENRTLTPFPQFTVESVLNGEFFSDLSKWYSDTYPLRELLVKADRQFESLFGFQPNQQMVGADQTADEVPDEQEDLDLEQRQTVEVPTEQAMADDIQGNIMGRLYVENDAAYSVYYFSKESVQQYAAAMSIAAQRLKGYADVYSIIVPNNSAVLLSDETLNSLGGTDQAHAIEYFYSLYDPLVHTVSVLETLRANNSHYLYYRTDHHWTADGAYFAYLMYCEKADLTPIDRSTLETVTYQPFLGSYYSQLDLQSMEDNPDYVKAYYPAGTNDMTYWNNYGDEVQGSVIQDVEGWADSSLYNAFICGDQPVCHVNNPQITDGSSVLLVKDSFGCAFAPWLVNNYQDVYIIDFRYIDFNIVDFTMEHGIQNVIFLNNIEIAGTTTVANRLTSEVAE